MAFGPAPTAMNSPGHLRGYSDFFASGFRAVSTGVRRRTTSLYSTTTSMDSDCDTQSSASGSIFPNVFRTRHQRRQARRPVSMMIPSPESSSSGVVDSRHRRRSSFVAFSSRLFDRMPFASSDENAGTSSASAKPRTKRFSRILRNSNTDSESSARDVWVTAGDPQTPSAPNGGPDENIATPRTIDPFNSSPESKSFFIDLSDSSTTTSDIIKRDSFLSMSTTASNSSPSISLFHYPRKERPISIQTMPLPPRSRCSSFHCRGQTKRDSWILEEDEADIFVPSGEPLAEEFEERDDAAQIDWRQFHIDLLTVEEA